MSNKVSNYPTSHLGDMSTGCEIVSNS